MTTERTGIEEALDRFEGSPSLLAKAINVPRTTVLHWRDTGIVAPEACEVIERVTLVPSERLNPKINWGFYRNRTPPKPPAAP